MTKFIETLINSCLTLRDGDISQLWKGRHLTLPSKEKKADKNKVAPAKPLDSAVQDMFTQGLQVAIPKIPDVNVFSLQLNGYNPALVGHDLVTRLGSDKLTLAYRNGRINRYLKFMILRLWKLRTNPAKFWVFASFLIMKSDAYMISCLHSIDKNLYRTKSLSYLVKQIRAINDLRFRKCPNSRFKAFSWGMAFPTRLMAFYINFRRVYIPKSPNKLRPLGVPAFPWRVFLRMWLIPVRIYFPLDKTQHGGIKGQGTMSAWNEIYKSVLPSRNVWEIDFRGFFPSIQPETLAKVFRQTLTKVPPVVAEYFVDMSKSRPMYGPLSAGAPVHEILHTVSSMLALLRDIEGLRWRLPSYEDSYTDSDIKFINGARKLIMECIETKALWNQEALKAASGNVPMKFINLNYFSPVRISEDKPAAADPIFARPKGMRGPSWSNTAVYSGLPQGSPLSPHFSMYILTEFKKFMDQRFPHVGWIAYVDDVIFYCDSDKDMVEFQYQFSSWSKLMYGIILSPEKSQKTKVAGVWQVKEFKYLGKIYNVETGQLRSSTRSGRTLNYTFTQLVSLGVLLDLNEAEKTFIGRVTKSVLTAADQGGREAHLMLYVYLLDRIINKWDSSKAEVFFLRKLLSLDPSLKRHLKRFTELTNPEQLESAMKFTVPAQWGESQGPVLHELSQGLSVHMRDLLAKMKSLPREAQGPFTGPFGGLVQSRLYQGSTSVSMNTASGAQDFVMRCEPGSLGHLLKSKAPGLSIFNGSSYACYEMVRLASAVAADRKIRLLPRGAMPYQLSQFDYGRKLMTS